MQSQQLSNGLELLVCVAIKIEKNEHAVVVAASRVLFRILFLEE